MIPPPRRPLLTDEERGQMLDALPVDWQMFAALVRGSGTDRQWLATVDAILLDAAKYEHRIVHAIHEQSI